MMEILEPDIEICHCHLLPNHSPKPTLLALAACPEGIRGSRSSSRFTSRVGGGSAFFARYEKTRHLRSAFWYDRISP